jgi:hypothetical protein
VEPIVGQPSAPGHIGEKKPVGGKESVAWRHPARAGSQVQCYRLGAVPAALGYIPVGLVSKFQPGCHHKDEARLQRTDRSRNFPRSVDDREAIFWRLNFWLRRC